MSDWVPDFLSEKQGVIFNLGTEAEAGVLHPNTPPAVLVCGPRYSSKSFGVDHRMIRHLWETPGSRVAIIAKTLRNTTDSGSQQRLMEHTMPKWLDANIGMEYTTHDGDGNPGFKTDGRTRTPYCRIRNMWGGESEIRILSVEHDVEIEQKLKDSFWSMIRLVELANFKDSKIFTVSWEQLRMPHLRPWQHMWIADTNPAPEGADSWIYKFWYQRDWGALGEGVSKSDLEKKANVERCREKFQKSLKLVELFLDDNPWLTQDQKDDRYAIHSVDAGEYDRDVLGRWTKGSGGRNRLFAQQFSHDIHVLHDDPDKDDFILLSPTTSEILAGWDLGTVNHAVVFQEKRIVKVGDREWPVWVALREIVSIGEQIQVSDIALMALEIMKELETLYKRPLTFRHWSDDSAMNVFRPSGEAYDYLTVRAATNDKIIMQGVPKPDGSVETRISITKRLLKEKRLYVSDKCPKLIECMEQASRGTKLSERLLPPFKHVWDAASYTWFMESVGDLLDTSFKPMTGDASSLISVRL